MKRNPISQHAEIWTSVRFQIPPYGVSHPHTMLVSLIMQMEHQIGQLIPALDPLQWTIHCKGPLGQMDVLPTTLHQEKNLETTSPIRTRREENPETWTVHPIPQFHPKGYTEVVKVLLTATNPEEHPVVGIFLLTITHQGGNPAIGIVFWTITEMMLTTTQKRKPMIFIERGKTS